MSLESLIRQRARKHGLADLREEFGVDLEQAVELHWRVLRALWVGCQIGATVTLLSLLMALGGWALWHGVTR